MYVKNMKIYYHDNRLNLKTLIKFKIILAVARGANFKFLRLVNGLLGKSEKSTALSRRANENLGGRCDKAPNPFPHK